MEVKCSKFQMLLLKLYFLNCYLLQFIFLGFDIEIYHIFIAVHFVVAISKLTDSKD